MHGFRNSAVITSVYICWLLFHQIHTTIAHVHNSDWICKSRSYRLWQEVQFFVTNTKTYQYTIKFHCQHKVVLGGLLLLATFLQPIGDLYEWSGSLMEFCWEGGGLIVIVKFCGAKWRPLLSFSLHFSWLRLLWGPYQGIFCLFTLVWHFFKKFCPLSGLPPTVELTWYYHLGAHLGKKNLCQFAGDLFLVYLARGWF